MTDRRLLLADDEADIRFLCRRLLRRAGWDVEAVDSGDRAVRAALQGSWTAIVLDHRMPGRTGLEAARDIRAGGYDGPLMIFSAYIDEAVRAAAAAAGVVTAEKTTIEELPGLLGALLEGSGV